MRIAYCINSICGLGGIQRCIVAKANALAAVQGNQVWIITSDDKGNKLFRVSESVYHIDLGINYYEDDWKSILHVVKGVLIKRRRHEKALAKTLKGINPDIVISVGQSEKYFVPAIKGDWVIIREYHFSRNYRFLAARGFFEKAFALGGEILERITLNKYDVVVIQTQEDLMLNWRNHKHTVVIPNPLTINASEVSPLENKRIISIGRLDYQKNHSSLLRAFSLVVEKHPDWRLVIFGEGSECSRLSSEIERLGLSGKANLKGVTLDSGKELHDSSMLVMSSRFEGMPLAILEAISCGLPVVSYASPCGPKDIITDGKDGFLVPVGDETALADRICRLIEDAGLRKRMGAAAYERSKDFSIERITSLWMDLFQDLLKLKREGV